MTLYQCNSPEETFDLGWDIGSNLSGGEAILLSGGLGAGKTLLAKGILHGLEFNIDEVTSPSFSLVNLYKTKKFPVFHIDLWRLPEGSDMAFSVGLDEILEDENAVVIIEWSERLGPYPFPSTVIRVNIEGEGDESRAITVEVQQQRSPQNA